MSLFDMLSHGPRLSSGKPPPKTRSYPQRTEKRKNAWKEAFDKIGGQGSTNELSRSKEASPRTAWKQLNQLVEEGLVERVGTVPSSGNGKDITVWRWKENNAS